MIRISARKSVVLASVLMLSAASIASAQNMTGSDTKASGEARPMPSPAGSTVQLTSQQEQALWTDISARAREQSAPAGFTAAVGQSVPTKVTLRSLPHKAAADVPAAKPYRYAMVNHQLLLVNPSDKKVIDVIAQ
jgi:hypothetical protein